MDNVNRLPRNSDIEGWDQPLTPTRTEERLGAAIPRSMRLQRHPERTLQPPCACDLCTFPRPVLEPLPPNPTPRERDLAWGDIPLSEQPQSGLERQVQRFYGLEMLKRTLPYLQLFEATPTPTPTAVPAQGQSRPYGYPEHEGPGPLYVKKVICESERTAISPAAAS